MERGLSFGSKRVRLDEGLAYIKKTAIGRLETLGSLLSLPVLSDNQKLRQKREKLLVLAFCSQLSV